MAVLSAEVKEWLVHPSKARNLIAQLVELVQVGIVCPVESLQALHGHRDLHECGEIANVEILDAADLSLGKNDLGS